MKSIVHGVSRPLILLSRTPRFLTNGSRRHVWNRHPLTDYIWPSSAFHLPAEPHQLARYIDEEMAAMDREMMRMAGLTFRPSLRRQIAPYVIENTGEDGVKKFHMELDMRRFTPKEITISTNTKENLLVVEGKHSDENTDFQYSRKVTIPEGVTLKDITAKYTKEGLLELEAPYTEPKADEVAPQVEAGGEGNREEAVINVDHK